MADHIEQIKSRLDIADVISGYLKLQKSGANYKARCPFHNEKTPSFHVSAERQIWHCFGCSKGGDIFGFIKEIEGVEFPEALRILAHRAGVELEEYDPTAKNEKNRLFRACELATKFFEKQLHESATGKLALKYLLDRGVKPETLSEFRLGFAPNDWHALGNFLGDAGLTDKEIIDAGLAIRRSSEATSYKLEAKSSFYDRFRSRITFPIFDVNGQVVGFTARIFDSGESKTDSQKPHVDVAKYINTPQTSIYDKSVVLYGLSKAKADIKQANRCLLVEGNMDALMSYQAGIRNVAATSGTALTAQQLTLLKRYTQNLDFCFDADAAGALATRRGIGLALSQNFAVKVVQIQDKDCKDPADYVQKYGSAWSDVVGQSKPVIDFYFDRARGSYDPASVESKKSVVAVVAPFIKRLASHVERAHWIARVANLLKVKEEAVIADVAAAFDDIGAYAGTARQTVAGRSDTAQPAAVRVENPAGPVDVSSEALLSLVLKNPLLFSARLADIDPRFLDPQVAEIIRKISALDAGKISAGTASFLDDIAHGLPDQNGSFRLEFAYLRSQELWKDFSDKDLSYEFEELLKKMRRKGISARLAGLELDIRQAEAASDRARMDGLMGEFKELSGQLAELQKI